MKSLPRLVALAILWAGVSFIAYSSNTKDVELPCVLVGIVGTIIIGRLY